MPTSEFPNTYGGHSLSGEEFAVGTTRSMDDGRLEVGSSLPVRTGPMTARETRPLALPAPR